jgi:hypothetical protein
VDSFNQIRQFAGSLVLECLWDWFASSGDMPTNDWKEFPNGQNYIERASAEGSPDVLE